jgi:hypothetical protein
MRIREWIKVKLYHNAHIEGRGGGEDVWLVLILDLGTRWG